MSAKAQSPPAQAERDWWLRLVLVLTQPASVFVWVRDDSDEAAAGAAGADHRGRLPRGHRDLPLDPTAGRLFDEIEFDWLLVLVEAVVAGLLVGIQNFWILGGAVYLGGRAADSRATYRQARHVAGLATTPFVLSLLFVWPVRIAVFGKDAFRSGGSDHGAAEDVFRGFDAAFALWAIVLLVVGVRTLNGWSWPRTFASLAVAGVVFVLIALLFIIG